MMCASSHDPLSLVKEKAGVGKRRELCRSSTSLRQVYRKWNSFQYEDLKKGMVPECWKENFRKVRGLIEGAMDRVDEKGHVVVLGAGVCSEVPLERMCREFRYVTLVDLDPESMGYAASGLDIPRLGKRLKMLEGDASLMMEALVRDVENALDKHPAGMPEAIAKEIMLSLFDRAAKGQSAKEELSIGEETADLVVSSDVMPYLITMPLSWIDVQYEKKFGSSAGLEYRPDIAQLLHAAIKSHFEEIFRLLKPGGIGFLETCVARGPIANDMIVLQAPHPVTGELLYTGIPVFGYDSRAGRMAELPDLVLNLMPPDALADPRSFRSWTVHLTDKVEMYTPMGMMTFSEGNVFQAMVVRKP